MEHGAFAWLTGGHGWFSIVRAIIWVVVVLSS